MVVSFGVIPKASISRNGYMVRGAGNPPDFELQVVPDILQGLDMMVRNIDGKFCPVEMRRDHEQARTRACTRSTLCGSTGV